jgi:hypothetical protein
MVAGNKMKKMPVKLAYLPKGMVYKMAFSVSSFNFAVMSDEMNPGATALTCTIFVITGVITLGRHFIKT